MALVESTSTSSSFDTASAVVGAHTYLPTYSLLLLLAVTIRAHNIL